MSKLEQTLNVVGSYPNPERIIEALQNADVMAVAGQGIVMRLKAHFLMLNEQRHHSFAKDGFYEQAAQLTGYSTQGQPTVSVTKQGILQRWKGGPILPKDRAYLSIPNYDHLEETYGRSPTEFSNLRVLFGRQKETGAIGPIALMADTEVQAKTACEVAENKNKRFIRTVRLNAEASLVTGKQRRSAHGEVLFWLKKQIMQNADPSVIPELDELAQAGLDAVMVYLQRVDEMVTIN